MNIILFGDSITAGNTQPEDKRWDLFLGNRIRLRFPGLSYQIINAGVGGNTSREGLARMDKDVLARAPDFVLVEFGGNDATPEPERFVPVSEFEANLANMKSRLDRLGRVTMVILTFPPIIDMQHSWKGHPHFAKAGGIDAMIEDYRQASREFARRNALPLADIDLAIRANPAANIMADGVHLTEAGNRVLTDVVFPIFEPLIANCRG